MEKQLDEITYQLNSLPKLFLDKRNSDELIAIEVGVGRGVYEEMYVTSIDSKVSLDCTTAWEQGSFLINIPVNKLYELLTTTPFHQFDSKILMDDYDWELLETTDGDMTYNKVNDIDIENVDEVIESLKGTEYEIKQEDIESILGYEVSEEELSEEEKEELISYIMNDLYNGGYIDDSEYVFDSLFYLKFNDQNFGEYYINWTYEKKELSDANEAFQKEEYERFLTTALKYLELTNQKLEYLIKSEQVESKELSKDVFDLILKISIAYEFVGKKEESAHYMNYYIQAGPTLDTRTYYFIGESFRKMKKFQEAIEQYLNCVNLQVDEYHVRAYESMGDCYFKLEDFENSAKYYSQAPRTSYNLYNVVISYFRMSNYSKAIEYSNLAIELDASYKWAYQERGKSYVQLGEYSLAVKDFTKVIELDASYIWAYLNRGYSYGHLGEYSLAVKDFTKAIELDASYIGAYQFRGESYAHLGEHSLAVKDYTKAIELGASFTFTYYFIGESFRKMKKFQEAIEQYLNCVNLQVDEYHVRAYESMGDCYFKLEDFENSAKYYSQAPRTSYNLYNVGISYFRMSNYSKAIEYFNLAIELDASYKLAYQKRGESYAHLGKNRLAVKDFTKVIELDASYKWAYQERGESYAQLGKNRLAVKDFTKVIELDASYEWAYQERGKIYFKLNKYKLAVKDFEKALELNASPEAWHYDLAFTYHFLGRYDEAVNWYEKLVGLSYKRYGYRKSLLLYYNIVTATKKVSPSLESEEVLLADTQDEHILEALLKRAETYYNYVFDELDTEFMLNDIDRILELDPKAYKAYYYRAIIFRNYRAQKFYSMEKAVEELKKCLEINRYVPALQLYARYVDDFDEGVSAIREAVTIEPDNASSWTIFGDILFNEDDFEGALEKYLKSNELNSDFCVLEITSTYTKLELYDLAIDVMYKHLAAHFQLSVSNDHGIAYEKLHEIFTLKYTSDEYKDVLKVLADFSYKTNQEAIAYLEEYEYQIQFDKRSIFSFLKFFKKGILKHFLEKGRYITKVHLLQNQDLDISFDLIKDIISTANYTVVEAAVAHRSVSVEVLDEIIDNDDNSYLYSYKLLGVLSNPNVLERQIERLKDNRFNWVRQKAYSITKELKDLDTTDRYVLLGLLNNPAAKESEATYKKLLETTSINIYTHKIEAGHVGIEEFSIHQLDFDKVVSVFSGENESQDYRTESTHLFSEYGITEFTDTILVCKNDDEEKIEIPSYLDELYRLDSSSKNFEGVSLEQVGEGFVQIRIDSGSGSMEFKSLEMEHEFRPEKLFPVYSHSGAIECYTYGNEKIEGKAVDFDLHTQIDDTYLHTENGLIFIDFEAIKVEIEELGIDIKDKNEVLHYFRKLLNGGLKK